MITARSMFRGATLFDQNLESWETLSLTDASGMFAGALAFSGHPFIANDLQLFDQSTFFDTACNPFDMGESQTPTTIGPAVVEVFGCPGATHNLPSYQLSTIQEPRCPSGLELSQTTCEPAAISLGLDYNDAFQVGSYNHIPCGCSYMSEVVDGLTNKLVYNTNTVNCQWDMTRTIGNLCYPTYQLSTIQEPRCPSGLELSQTTCEPAAISLGLDYSNFQVGSYNHIPCGCSYMSEVVDGLTNKLVYNTNTVNCQWETRTIGNLCEFLQPYYELVSQIHFVPSS